MQSSVDCIHHCIANYHVTGTMDVTGDIERQLVNANWYTSPPGNRPCWSNDQCSLTVTVMWGCWELDIWCLPLHKLIKTFSHTRIFLWWQCLCYVICVTWYGVDPPVIIGALAAGRGCKNYSTVSMPGDIKDMRVNDLLHLSYITGCMRFYDCNQVYWRLYLCDIFGTEAGPRIDWVLLLATSFEPLTLSISHT